MVQHVNKIGWFLCCKHHMRWDICIRSVLCESTQICQSIMNNNKLEKKVSTRKQWMDNGAHGQHGYVSTSRGWVSLSLFADKFWIEPTSKSNGATLIGNKLPCVLVLMHVSIIIETIGCVSDHNKWHCLFDVAYYSARASSMRIQITRNHNNKNIS